MQAKIDKERGMLNFAEFIPSPNYDERPSNSVINLLVIHNISLPPLQFEGQAVVEFFTNRLNYKAHPFYEQLTHLKVSAHLFIRRNGHCIQFVPFHYRAWHAGESSFKGQTKCNNFSIGIELEGADDIPYTNAQYEQLCIIASVLMKTYPEITIERIVGHQTIAPERKTDPGPSFDWGYFYNRLEKEASNEIHHSSVLSHPTSFFER